MQIEKELNKLNIEWFNQKKSLFLKEPFYSKELGYIYDEITERTDFFSEEGHLIESTQTRIIDKKLNDYCWYSYFYGSKVAGRLSNEVDVNDLPFDARDVANTIISIHKTAITSFTEVLAIHNSIQQVMSDIREWIKSKEDPSAEYQSFLNFFLQEFTKLFLGDFGYIQKQIELVEQEDKLEFNLNQDQLAALIFIINKAGFFNTLNVQDSKQLLIFCQKYFQFKTLDGYKKSTSKTQLSNKYNEHASNNNLKPLLHVVEKLRLAIDEFKRG